MNIGRKFFSKKTLFLAAFLGIFLFLPSGSQAQLSAYNDTERACIEKPDPDLIALQIPIIGCDAAQETAGEICCSTDKVYTIGVKDAPNYVVTFFRFAIIFLAIFLVILIMIGGVMYLASGGSPDYITKAKGLISKSAISMVLLLFSVVLLNQINPALIKLEVKGIVAIEAVKCCQIGGSVAAAASTPAVVANSGTTTILSTTPITGGNSIVARYPDGKCYQYTDSVGEMYKVEAPCPDGTGGPAGYASPVTAPTQKIGSGPATYAYMITDASGKLVCPPGGVPLEEETQCLSQPAIIDKEEIQGCEGQFKTNTVTAPVFDSKLQQAIKNVAKSKGIDPCVFYAIITQESKGKINAFADDRRVRSCGIVARRTFICNAYKQCCGSNPSTCDSDAACKGSILDKSKMPPPVDINNLDVTPGYTYGFGVGQMTYTAQTALCANNKGFMYFGKCREFAKSLELEYNLDAMADGITQYYCPSAKNNGKADLSCFSKYAGSGAFATCTGNKKLVVYNECVSKGFDIVSSKVQNLSISP